MKDDSLTAGEDFEKMKSELESFDESTKQRIDTIKRDKLNWAAGDEEDGINIDEELDEEEIGQRFTKLKPEGGNRRNNRDEFRG